MVSFSREFVFQTKNTTMLHPKEWPTNGGSFGSFRTAENFWGNRGTDNLVRGSLKVQRHKELTHPLLPY